MGYPVDKDRLKAAFCFILIIFSLMYIFPAGIGSMVKISKYHDNYFDFVPQWRSLFHVLAALQACLLIFAFSLIIIFIVAVRALLKKNHGIVDTCLKILLLIAIFTVSIFATTIFIMSAPSFKKDVDSMTNETLAYRTCEQEANTIPGLQHHPSPGNGPFGKNGEEHKTSDGKCKKSEDHDKKEEVLSFKRNVEFLMLSQSFLLLLLEVWLVITVYKIKNAPDVRLRRIESLIVWTPDDIPVADDIQSSDL